MAVSSISPILILLLSGLAAAALLAWLSVRTKRQEGQGLL
jgi:hypothetical protein